jgi:hypothetical protein
VTTRAYLTAVLSTVESERLWHPVTHFRAGEGLGTRLLGGLSLRLILRELLSPPTGEEVPEVWVPAPDAV